MKKFFLSAVQLWALFILYSVSFISCKQDNTGNPYFISFIANDTVTKYDGSHSRFQLLFNAVSRREKYTYEVTGVTPVSNLIIHIKDSKPLMAASYGWSVPAQNVSPQTYIHFFTHGMLYSSAKNGEVLVTITEMTDTEIRGTFSGTVQSDPGTSIKITDGKFFIPIVE